MQDTQDWIKENIIPLLFNSNKLKLTSLGFFSFVVFLVGFGLFFPFYYLKRLFYRKG